MEKKLKGILLFGILTLLGIGSSFGYHSYFGLEYIDTSNRYQNFLFDSNGYGGITISSANSGTFSSLDYVRYTGKNNLSTLAYLDISNYSLTGSFSFPFSNAGTSNGYLYVDGNNIAFRYFNNSYTPNFNYLLNISNSVSLQNYFLNLKNAGVFIRTLTNNGDGILNENPFKESISPNGYRSFIFVDTGVYDTNLGQYLNDTEFSGVVYSRGVFSPGVFSEYSFSLVPTYSYNSGSYVLSVDYDSLPFLFRTVRPGLSDSDWISYRGLFIIKLDSLYRKTNIGDFNILALSLSGDNYLYSRYSCPANSTSFIYCTFIDGGLVGQSNLSNSFTSFKSTSFSSIRPSSSLNLFNDLTFFLTSPDSLSFDATYSDISISFSKSIYSIESDNTIQLYRPVRRQTSNSSTASYSNSVLERSFGLISQDGINILEEFLTGGNSNQSFPDSILDGGVFDANTFLIEESIKCYLTSGEVCNSPFTYENSTNYVNNYDHQERVRNSVDKTGYLTFNNSVDMLSQYCLNVNSIQYAFCSQLSLYEGSPITYYYNNGYFNYIISGSGWQVNLGTLWSGQLGYAYCEGPYCSNFNEGLPQFIRKDTGDYSDFGFSGEYVSLDFFKNYFENGFFFQCPFSYSGSYFTIGSKLIDRLDKHDPLKPINCMIAGFSHGIKTSFFGDSKLGLSHSGVFLQNTGPFATRFYTFIDIVLSLGYIFLFSKLFKFLKKH